MIIPDIVKDKWKSQPTTLDILKTELQTTRTQLEEELQTTRTQLDQKLQTTRTQLEGELQAEKTKTYELQQKVELLEMSHGALVERIEALEKL
tara:strand:+ start:1391 stop:1669 length:279 start_codon:yes stop_codon:yes gene_type:complete